MNSYTAWTRTSVAYNTYATASSKCGEAFAPAGPAPQLGAWTHPGTGETRQYINNLDELIGFDYSTYRTGNISSAILDGETISNAKAFELRLWLRATKLWLVGDRLMIKVSQSQPRCITTQGVIATVRAALTAHGHQLAA